MGSSRVSSRRLRAILLGLLITHPAAAALEVITSDAPPPIHSTAPPHGGWLQSPPAILDHGTPWRTPLLFALMLILALYWNRRLQREVTRLRRAKRTLARRERRYREMVELAGASDFHFYSIAPSGRLEYASPSSFELFGIPAEEMVGRHWRDIAAWSESGLAHFQSAMDACLRGEVPAPVTLEFFGEGMRQQLISHPRPVRDDQGRTIRIEGITINLTPRLRLEEHLFAAIAAAREADSAKSAFLANMSHEIRTPMNAIIGMLHLCLESPMSEEQRGYLESARRASESLLRQLSDILDLSKAEAGRLTLEKTPFAIEESIASLAPLAARRGRHPGVGFRVRIAPEVPRTLVGDSLRLGQVLTNLVDNALKFTERGEVTLSVRTLESARGQERAPGLEARTQRVRLEFAVEDTGIGIARSQFGHLFEPFRQADTSITRRYGGTGLGLSISRHLVELMGGAIEVASQEGVGSTFRFDVWMDALALPSECPHETATPREQNREARRASRPPGEPEAYAPARASDITPLLDELRRRAARRDPTTEDLLAEHRQTLAERLPPERFSTLSDQITNYRFADASATLDDLRLTPDA